MEKFTANLGSWLKWLVLPFVGLVLSRVHEAVAAQLGLSDEGVYKVVATVFEFFRQPLPLVLLGVGVGLVLYPTLQRLWVRPKSNEGAEAISFTSVRSRASELEYKLKRFVQDWDKPQRSRGMTIRPVLKPETRAELVALLARFRAMGLAVPEVQAKEDLDLALFGYWYLNGVYRLLDKSTFDDAKTTSRDLVRTGLAEEEKDKLKRRLLAQ
ncbi:MAG: hypothetical protein O9248_01570 [Rhodobacteraceae bacterium]|nr:hypothetical protein [Paracoccaceae bacterium]